MKPLYLVLISFLFTLSANGSESDFELSDSQIKTAQELIETALTENKAFEIVESLTTEIGPRMGGSEAEKQARAWGKKLGKSLEFDKVSIEEFKMPSWERGEIKITLTQPYEQDLYGTALGGSASTTELVSEDLVYFRSLDDLIKAPEGTVSGKIAFIDGDLLVKSQTGAGYSQANQKRRVGWQHAQNHHAKALVIRSVGSDQHRFPHTGMMSSKDGEWPSIPVIAISNPDADHLRRLHKFGKKMSLDILSESDWKEEVVSGNVILDLVGREKPDEIVLIGAHLDSWDLGTGAVDDGAGIGITVAAAELIARLPKRPKRTIRVVMFGAEEVGLLGAKAYAERHKDDVANYIVATESDFGADSIWQLSSNVNPAANVAIDEIGKLLAPLGIVRGSSEAPGGGPDIIPLDALGVPTVRLNQNGMDYFDLHHTPDDTLDKVNPDKLKQNVAAYAVLAYLMAEIDMEFRKIKTEE